MKAQMLKMAGVKTEAAFYKKYPTQEAFMKAHGKAFEKAQFGNMFDKGLNVGNRNVPSGLGYTPMSTSLTSSGFKMPDAAGAFAKANPLPAGVQSMKVPDSIGGATSKIPGAGQILGAATGIINAAGAFKQQKNKLQGLRQQNKVVGVQRQAKNSIDVDAARQRQDSASKAREAIMQPIDPGSIYPVNGVGTNVLAKNGMMLEDGGEIQNTYAPNDLYDDLGYEPLEDSTQVKQYNRGGFVKAAGGFSSFMGGGGTDFANKMVGNAFGNNAGSQMGQAVGGALKMIPGVGTVAGAVAAPILGAIGGLADNMFGDAGKIKDEQKELTAQTDGMLTEDNIKTYQGQNSSSLRDGGYVSNDWTPQMIAKFGDHSPEDVYDFAHEGMDSLRAGGHLKEYRDPSERAMQTFAMGGDLKTHWGGHMEEMSENPYLPDGGVTYMPHGQSHDEADGNGRTGIGITYGDNPVEVERREPIMKLRDGSTGEDNLVVFGNLEIPKYGVDMLGDKKAKGMKFKNYVADLSKSEAKQNKTISKSIDEVDALTPRDSFDKLKLSGLQANILGGNMKLKEIAQTKEKAAALQNAINDTAEELGVDADSLAKGKVKTAKMGGKFSKAQVGGWYEKNKPLFMTNPADDNVDMYGGQLNDVVVTAPKRGVKRPELSTDVEMPVAPEYNRSREQMLASEEYQQRLPFDIIGDPLDTVEPLDGKSKKSMFDDENGFDFNKLTPYMKAINDLVPTLRPSDAEDLNANQLYGELNALANNQEEPVQAQLYNPQLASSYNVSLQDTMNEITAQTRAAQKMAQGNPALQAMIAAQAYGAINKVKGEEFRMNQALDNQVKTGNIATLNDAKVKNLGILDNQYVRQATAKANTKAVQQAALNSISDKYAKNNLENRTLKTYENMYNYRYDDNGRAINMNPLAQWNTSGLTSSKGSGKGLAPGYEFTYDADQNIIGTRKAGRKDDAKNGSIVKAMRNL